MTLHCVSSKALNGREMLKGVEQSVSGREISLVQCYKGVNGDHLLANGKIPDFFCNPIRPLSCLFTLAVTNVIRGASRRAPGVFTQSHDAFVFEPLLNSKAITRRSFVDSSNCFSRRRVCTRVTRPRECGKVLRH